MKKPCKDNCLSTVYPDFAKEWDYEKNHITKKLKAKFEFVQLRLTKKQIKYVKENQI